MHAIHDAARTVAITANFFIISLVLSGRFGYQNHSTAPVPPVQRTAIASLAQRAIQARRIRAGTDPSAAGIALLAAVQGGLLLAHLNRDDGPLVEALDRALAQLGGA
jgi:hypothetical protein